MPIVGNTNPLSTASTIRQFVHETTYQQMTIGVNGSTQGLFYFERAIVTDAYRAVINCPTYEDFSPIGHGTTGWGPQGFQTTTVNMTMRRSIPRQNMWYDYEEYWLSQGQWYGVTGPVIVIPVTT